jgi:hypothetical protein
MLCMVLGRILPREFVIAGHLLPRRVQAYASSILRMGVNDPRNGLLWNSAVEEAYENHW